MYSVYRSTPADGAIFDNDVLRAIQKKQILLHIIRGEKWQFWLGAYTLSDWLNVKTHEEFYEYFHQEHGLNGDWNSFCKLYRRKLFPMEHLDLRIQPIGRIVFGILVLQHVEMTNRILHCLQENLGEEHIGLSPWNTLGKGSKNYLANLTTVKVRECVEALDAIDSPVYVMRSKGGKNDLLGGHAMVTEFIDTVDHFSNGENVPEHIWPMVLQMTNVKAFYREVEEELGLVADPTNNIGDALSYRGKKTNDILWIRFVWVDEQPVRMVISA